MEPLVSSCHVTMANFAKVLSILFLMFAFTRGLRIRKRIKIQKQRVNPPESVRPNYVSQSPRETRFLNPFSLFNIITFSNTACTTSSGTGGEGSR